MKNRSVPTDTVLPHISYQKIEAAGEWLARVFGFCEAYRYGDPVSGIQMFLGQACINLHRAGDEQLSPAQLGYGTQMLTIFAEDVDAHYQRSLGAGTPIFEELHETVYGERQYGVEDIEGHRWLFSWHARDLKPEDWGATVPAR